MLHSHSGLFDHWHSLSGSFSMAGAPSKTSKSSTHERRRSRSIPSQVNLTADLVDEGGLRGGVGRGRSVVLRSRMTLLRRRRHLSRVGGDPVGGQDPLQEVLPDHVALRRRDTWGKSRRTVIFPGYSQKHKTNLNHIIM